MTYELKRVDPLRAANIGALVYGLLLTAFAVLFSPFLVMAVLFLPSEGGAMAMMPVLLMLILYPVLGFVMGWISGFLTSAIYNLVIRWSGGLLFEMETS